MSQNNNNIITTQSEKIQNVQTSLTVGGKTKVYSLGDLSPSSIENYDPDIQANIRALADNIDVTETDKVNAYAEGPVKNCTDGLSKFLEKMKDTPEDRQTVELIAELSAKVSNESSDLKVVMKEKNFFQKLLARIFKEDPNDATLKKIDSCKLLIDQLGKLMTKQIQILSERHDDAQSIIDINLSAAEQLEYYLVAGYIASERITQELLDSESKSSSMTIRELNALNEKDAGLQNFNNSLVNIEQLRLGTWLATMEAVGDKKLIAILENNYKSTMNKMIMLFLQQAVNGMLGATIQNAIDGQKNLRKLNESLMTTNADNLSRHFVEVANIVTSNLMDVKVAEACAQIVYDGYLRHQEIMKEVNSNMGQKKHEVVEAMKPIGDFMAINPSPDNSINSSNSSASTFTSDELKF